MPVTCNLLQYLDGKTVGPQEYSGNIGKSLKTCQKLPVVNFGKINVTLPQVDVDVLSTDKKYLYEMCQGISDGNVNISLCRRDPGRMCHSRWLTTANRILRL